MRFVKNKLKPRVFRACMNMLPNFFRLRNHVFKKKHHLNFIWDFCFKPSWSSWKLRYYQLMTSQPKRYMLFFFFFFFLNDIAASFTRGQNLHMLPFVFSLTGPTLKNSRGADYSGWGDRAATLFQSSVALIHSAKAFATHRKTRMRARADGSDTPTMSHYSK